MAEIEGWRPGTPFVSMLGNETEYTQMKASKNILLGVMMMIGSVAIASTPPQDSIEVVETKYRNLFVFKADRSLLGSEVEVYHSNGDLVSKQVLSKRKMVIDFCDVKFGNYVIKVVKDGIAREFSYEKKLIISEVIR